MCAQRETGVKRAFPAHMQAGAVTHSRLSVLPARTKIMRIHGRDGNHRSAFTGVTGITPKHTVAVGRESTARWTRLPWKLPRVSGAFSVSDGRQLRLFNRQEIFLYSIRLNYR
jgi:hypothetical protein